jgi:hypothetical protein
MDDFPIGRRPWQRPICLERALEPAAILIVALPGDEGAARSGTGQADADFLPYFELGCGGNADTGGRYVDHHDIDRRGTARAQRTRRHCWSPFGRACLDCH